jgi:hypothetical protein
MNEIERRRTPKLILSDNINERCNNFTHRILNMNTKSKIALAAVLFSAIASPSFAGDQDLRSEQISSGRIIGTQYAVPAGAYASAHGWAHRGSTVTRDFQLQGKE